MAKWQREDGMTAETEAKSPDLKEMEARIRSGKREGHYYVALLGFRTYEAVVIYKLVRKGFAFSTFERFRKNTSLSQQDLADLTQITARTLNRRREAGKLEPEESDRLLRASRIFARALELFEGDREAAKRWLSTPEVALGGLVPLELAKTDVGAQEVEFLVGRLEHGIPA